MKNAANKFLPRLSKGKNYIPVLIIIAAVLLSFVFLKNERIQSSSVPFLRVYVDGKVYAQEEIEAGKQITIRQENGQINVIRMTENGFFMESSDCKNQLCVHQGEVNTDNFSKRSLGTHILCLPHRLDAELIVNPSSAEAEEIPDA